MSEKEHVSPDPEMNEIEAALGSLAPSKNQIDRDRLMFLAGQARREPYAPGRWPWRAIAAALALVALGEAALIANRPDPEQIVVERLVVVQEPAIPELIEVEPEPSPEPEPEGLAPVVILSQASSRSNSITAWESGWPSIQLRREVLQRGIEGLPEPPPLAMISNGEVPEPPRRPLRAELESFLNPGESS
ncbi:hypothetical protein BH23PLA1_BH23PLA1_34050 [soil metagenome]